MVKIGRQKTRPNRPTLVSPAPVGWRTLAEKVYYMLIRKFKLCYIFGQTYLNMWQTWWKLGGFSHFELIYYSVCVFVLTLSIIDFLVLHLLATNCIYKCMCSQFETSLLNSIASGYNTKREADRISHDGHMVIQRTQFTTYEIRSYKCVSRDLLSTERWKRVTLSSRGHFGGRWTTSDDQQTVWHWCHVQRVVESVRRSTGWFISKDDISRGTRWKNR